MTEKQMLAMVERYSRENITEVGEIKITRVADQKTVFIEQIGESGRSVIMNQYRVDGKIIWAGYSSRSQTVYVSLAN